MPELLVLRHENQDNMGLRNYDPGLGAFPTRDMYAGVAADMALTTDPFSGGVYAFGDANPISNIELDGHMIDAGNGCIGSLQAVTACSERQEQEQAGSLTSSPAQPRKTAYPRCRRWSASVRR